MKKHYLVDTNVIIDMLLAVAQWCQALLCRTLGAVIGGAIAAMVTSHKDMELQIFGEKFGGKGK